MIIKSKCKPMQKLEHNKASNLSNFNQWQCNAMNKRKWSEIGYIYIYIYPKKPRSALPYIQLKMQIIQKLAVLET